MLLVSILLTLLPNQTYPQGLLLLQNNQEETEAKGEGVKDTPQARLVSGEYKKTLASLATR